jgi:DNA polymerase III alpha subunit
MIRNMKVGEGWARIDVLDNTGSTGIFMDPERDEIEKGKIYILLAADNRVVDYCLDEDVTENKEDPFVKYLWELDYPDMPKGMYKVVAFRARKTKAGKDMAYMVVADGEKNLTSVLVFDSIFKKAQALCKEGSVLTLELEKMRDGGITLRNALG